jgi:hypothetical protein
MKTTSTQHLVRRGKKQTYYCRHRIPTALLAAYPGKTEIIRSLRTSDAAQAAKRLRIELVRIDAEFQQHSHQQKERENIAALRRVTPLTDEHVQCLASFWVREVLLTDAQTRQRGLDDDEFDECDALIRTQREELGKMLARGKIQPILPALYSFIHLCGLDVDLSQEQAQKVGYPLLKNSENFGAPQLPQCLLEQRYRLDLSTAPHIQGMRPPKERYNMLPIWHMVNCRNEWDVIAECSAS